MKIIKIKQIKKIYHEKVRKYYKHKKVNKTHNHKLTYYTINIMAFILL